MSHYAGKCCRGAVRHAKMSNQISGVFAQILHRVIKVKLRSMVNNKSKIVHKGSMVHVFIFSNALLNPKQVRMNCPVSFDPIPHDFWVIDVGAISVTTAAQDNEVFWSVSSSETSGYYVTPLQGSCCSASPTPLVRFGPENVQIVFIYPCRPVFDDLFRSGFESAAFL